MAAILDIVRPGDVISSDLLNRIIALLNEHDAAIAGGGSSSNLITGFNPPTQQEVGASLTVFGTFDFPLQTNNLTIDNIPIPPANFLIGSGATQLVFTIPASIVVPPATTRQVVVRVSNSQGQGERSYLLAPSSASSPPPTISALLDHGSSTLPLRSQSDVRITGLNFASPAGANRVRLIFNPGATPTFFPPSASDSLPINLAASTINTAPTESTLVATLPAIGAALIPVVGQTAPAAIEVTVPGAGTTVMQGVLIRRMA